MCALTACRSFRQEATRRGHLTGHCNPYKFTTPSYLGHRLRRTCLRRGDGGQSFHMSSSGQHRANFFLAKLVTWINFLSSSPLPPPRGGGSFDDRGMSGYVVVSMFCVFNLYLTASVNAPPTNPKLDKYQNSPTSSMQI